MKMLRFVGMVVLVALLVAVLRLPDAASPDPEHRYAALPLADFASAGRVAREGTGQPGMALLLLDYAVERQLPDARDCSALRASITAELLNDRSTTGRLWSLGVAVPLTGADWYQRLTGQSVADAFAYGPAAQEWPGGHDSLDDLLRAVRKPITTAFPTAAPALGIAAAAHATGALSPPLAGQLVQALQFVQSEPTNFLAVAAVQESILPLHQLARVCRSWADFQALLRSAASVDQVRLLTRLAGATPGGAHPLAQLLALTQTQAPDLTGPCLGRVTQQGIEGLDRLHDAMSHGPEGLRVALQHPELAKSVLAATAPAAARVTLGGGWWTAQRAAFGRLALAAKYGFVALLCLGVLVLLVPWGFFRDRFAPATPLAGLGQDHLRRAYALLLALTAVAISLLLILPSIAPAERAAADAAASGGSATADAPNAGIQTTEGGQTLALVLLLAAILIVQGGCYWIARRKLREVELGGSVAGSDAHATGLNPESPAAAALKLRRLENLDIFFDLPLYCGLALTIFAFILITTFGAGISRFLAYGSTFVGIVFAVLIRVAHLYPLRERLIHQASP